MIGVITPYAMALFAQHMFSMSAGYKIEGNARLARSYLFCVSIEVGLKASILAQDCNDTNKAHIKQLGHNLCKVAKSFSDKVDKDFLSKDDFKILAGVNPFFEKKGLEYFTAIALHSTLTAHKSLPELEALHELACKVNRYLESRNCFIEANTSTGTIGRGIITFV